MSRARVIQSVILACVVLGGIALVLSRVGRSSDGGTPKDGRVNDDPAPESSGGEKIHSNESTSKPRWKGVIAEYRDALYSRNEALVRELRNKIEGEAKARRDVHTLAQLAQVDREYAQHRIDTVHAPDDRDITPEEVYSLLERISGDSDDQQSRDAYELLKRKRLPPETLKFLVSKIRQASTKTQQGLLMSLLNNYIGHESIQALLDFAGDAGFGSDAQIVALTLLSSRRLEDRDLRTLIKLYKGAAAQSVRGKIAGTLSGYAYRLQGEIAKLLSGGIRNEDPRERSAAIEALDPDTEQGRAQLLGVLADEPVATIREKILSRMSFQLEETGVADALAQYVEKEVEEYLRLKCVRLFRGAVLTNSVETALIRLAEYDQAEEVRAAAAEVLELLRLRKDHDK